MRVMLLEGSRCAAGGGSVRAGEVFEEIGESGVVHVEVCRGGVFALVCC